MKWTEEQKQAILKEGTNIIVSAGAGSGKTAVLSERVLRKIQDGVDIRDILILTFTNEAAGEMKNRIRKKLMKAGLVDALETIDSAYITTFDAYALGMVKKYHALLNISNQVSIIDSSMIDLEKSRILDELFLELYEKKDASFLRLVNDFTTRDDDMIKEAIFDINAKLDLKYDKKEYLSSYFKHFYNEEYIDTIFQEYFSYIKELCDEVEANLYLLEGLLDEELYQKVYDAYSPFIHPRDYGDLYRLKDKPRIQFRNIPEEAIPVKEELKKDIEEIFSLTSYCEEELKEQVFCTKDYVEAIISIILEFDKRLMSYKWMQEAFEFTDIAKMAISLVKEHPEIRNELKESYNEILIDEYQDTNDLQELFISEIENNNVYMVGDIKQSIYRFRNANPAIFKNKYDAYSKHEHGEAINLLKNFRSRSEVLDNINLIFGFLMSEEFGGVPYRGNHEMVYGNLLYINEGLTKENHHMEIIQYDNENKLYTNSEIEAFTIAKDIMEKIKKGYLVYDFSLNAKRKVQYQDFCIILDRGSDMALYKKVFEYFNIPMVVYKDNDLVVSHDLLILKNIIRLILSIKNKEYDTKMRYYFVSIARSFLFSLTDQEILHFINTNTFYNHEIYQICFSLTKDIDRKTPGVLLKEIIDVFHFYEKSITVGNVESSRIRLFYLFDLSKTAEELGFTIKEFGDYLEQMITKKKEIRYKDQDASNSCVRIMNIHKSKGLEFPICYFAGLKKDFNLKDLQSRFLFDTHYGILTPYFKEGIGTLFTKTLIRNAYYKEEISEKIRLFYVALTRAKEKMIFVLPKIENPMKPSGVVDKKIANKYRSFYDFLSSIGYFLENYTKTIALESLNLTKDYEKMMKKNNQLIGEEKQKIQFIDVLVNAKEIENRHASKEIQEVLSVQEAKKLDYGTQLHEKLEMTNFKEESSDTHVNHLKEQFDFASAMLYQELEFYFSKDNMEYHGIIDLMLEYEDEIKIIDYKLKNIEDDAYLKQLMVYYDYVSSIRDKKITLYLYSILDNQVKEVKVNSMV